MRDFERLSSTLARDSAWRKKELSHLRVELGLEYYAYETRDGNGKKETKYQYTGATFETPTSTFGRRANIRAINLMAYSHFEGFTKYACKTYLNELSEVLDHENPKHPNLREHLRQSKTAHKLPKENGWSLSEKDLTLLSDTRSNLSYTRLVEMLDRIDLWPIPFMEENQDTIGSLLQLRNGISHGDGDPQFKNVSVEEGNYSLARTLEFVNESFEVFQVAFLDKAQTVFFD